MDKKKLRNNIIVTELKVTVKPVILYSGIPKKSLQASQPSASTSK